MMTTTEAVVTILMVALATAITRFLPFLIFSNREKTPAYIIYLGKVLPYSVIGLLIVYCFKGVKPLDPPHGIPEALAALATAGLFLWRKNVIAGIAGGTVIYMLLIRYF